AKFYGADLSGAYYDDSTRFSRGFDPKSRNMQKF
ncbi:MAG: pentapeptide repeat-containing protein, partial [Nodularia sp. (in: cyanobacteria)]|nr:pentapeptide repeat-containing protein [Nodularia sp. (in: cyanobacteria)]